MFNKKILSIEDVFYFRKDVLTDYNLAPVVTVPSFLLDQDNLPVYSKNIHKSINTEYRCLPEADHALPFIDFFKKNGAISFFMVNQDDYFYQKYPLRIYGYNNFTVENKQAQISINHCYSLPKLNFWQRNIFRDSYYKGTLRTTVFQACALYFGAGFDDNVPLNFPIIVANTNFKFIKKYYELGFELASNESVPQELCYSYNNLRVFLTKEKALGYYKSKLKQLNL